MFQRTLLKIYSHLRTSEYSFMMLMATLIGVLGGLGAIAFRYLIRLVQITAYGARSYTLEMFGDLAWWHIVLVPAIGGLLVGPIVYYFAREAKGHGVPEVMEAVATKQGVIRKRIVFAKTLASAISIGTGASVGREGPIVQIGSAIGSSLGQFMRVSQSKLRTMVGCGAAAGIAATFNAPVAGVLFALEVILGNFGVRLFTPIVISSVIATVVSHSFLGNTPAFEIAITYDLVSPFELLTYSVLGLAAGLVAIVFIRLVYGSEDLFDRARLPALVKPVLGGLMIGVIGLKFPHIFGVGYETIEMALNNEIAWRFMLVLVGIKILATSLTLGSGGSGGIFAPSLFIGAALGGSLGHLFHHLFPEMTASPGAYALVGMGAVVAATTHAPLTSIIIIFELTDDYKIILPLMFACIIGNALSSKLNRESIYTMKLIRRGLNIHRGRDVNMLKSLKVQSVLNSDYLTISEDTQLSKMIQMMARQPQTHFYVTDSYGILNGVVAVENLRQVILDSGTLENLVIAQDIMQVGVRTVRAEDSLDKVMRLFGNTKTEELPVVDGSNGKKMVGVVTRQSVISAYNNEIMKRDAFSEVLGGISATEETGPVMLSNGVSIGEVEAPGWMVGKTLSDLHLRKSRGILVLLINPTGPEKTSSEQLQIVPQPDYEIHLGDNLLVLGPVEAIKALKG
ncbi:chloride channel protein [Acidobacteriota bacterium]